MTPSDKPVALIVGASRGIGRQIAVDLAKENYAVIVAAKTISDPSKSLPSNPDPKSKESTITTVTREIIAAGGTATAIQVDVRSPESIQNLVDETISIHGRLDVLVYNSGAIYWAPVASTPLRRYSLMQSVNPDGLYATVQASLPHLRAVSKTLSGGRIVVVSPPIYSRFFRGKTAYAMGKIAMSVLTMGLGMDFDRERRSTEVTAAAAPAEADAATPGNLSITSLWPAVAIESAATEQFTRANPDEARDLRTPSIFSHAVLEVLRADHAQVNGRLLLDEDFLREVTGRTDFSAYSVVPGAEPRRIMPRTLPDLSVAEQDDQGKRYDSSKAKL